MTGLAIGSIKARDEISEVVVVIAFRTRLLDTFVLVFFVFVFLNTLRNQNLILFTLCPLSAHAQHGFRALLSSNGERACVPRLAPSPLSEHAVRMRRARPLLRPGSGSLDEGTKGGAARDGPSLCCRVSAPSAGLTPARPRHQTGDKDRLPGGEISTKRLIRRSPSLDAPFFLPSARPVASCSDK